MRFGQSILYRKKTTILERVKLFIYGHDFIGAVIRKAHIEKAIKKIPPFHTVLDAGCGTGEFSFLLAQKYPATFFAYDIVPETIKKNNEIKDMLHLNNLSFKNQNLLTLDEKNRYDFIFSIGTLIYFSKKQTQKILENLTAALRKEGYLYLDLPQRDFLEVNFINPSHYPHYYEALQKENSGDLYTIEEMQQLLENLGYELFYTTKSFSYFGKCAWELDNVLKEKKWYRVRSYLFLPFLRFLAALDATTKHKKGCCFVILARKKA